MRTKFLALILLLAVSALLSGNVRYAAAQHRTLDFVVLTDPCSTCAIQIANGTIAQNKTTGQTGSYFDGPYNVTAYPTSGYTFEHWNYTVGLSLDSNTTNPSHLIIGGNGTLILHLKSPTTAIQPVMIVGLALGISALPILLRRSRKPIALN